MRMYKTCNVQFSKNGKSYSFDSNNIKLREHDFVVVETVKGIELGQVAGLATLPEDKLVLPLKKIIRKATSDDLAQAQKNVEALVGAIDDVTDLAKARNLEMKVLSVEYTLNRSRLVVKYNADSRIDFRELLKDLATKYKTRIEMRQIGERDGAKVVGGIGTCGRPLCCANHMVEFDNISINMPKKQGVSLNPTKISGCCGKLKCCFKHEEESYECLNKRFVKEGQIVEYQGHLAKVISKNMISNKVRVILKSGMILSCTNEDLRRLNDEEIATLEEKES